MNPTNGTGHSRGVPADAPVEVLEEVSTPLVATTPGAGALEVSPLRLAERILERPDWARRCLLVTDESGKYVALRTLDPETGIWRDPEAVVLGWLGEIGDILESDAYLLASKHRMDPKTVSGMVRAIRSIKSPRQVDTVCHSFGAALDRHRALGLEPLIRQCRPADMDADLRYLGVLNGVVDLHTARLLPAEEAATALVTIYAPVPYHPEILYPAADWFLSHLSPRERGWWLDILGFALRGVAKRLYGCLAPPDAGKTSAINLLRATLGPYVASPTVGALDAKVLHDASGHTPGMFAWLAPVRITIVDEVKERELSAPLVKDLTGGGWFTARDTYKQKVTKRATGTTFMFANDVAGEQPLPQLRTDDPGMKARYRELPFPVIPKEQQDPAMRDEWPYDVERQAQLLTLLVQRAAMNPTEPADIPQVRDATAARIRKDSGELGSFAARFVRDGSSVVKFRNAWDEWCAVNNESVAASAPGGVLKRDFSRRLNAHVEGLGVATSLRIDGRKVRGWRGWRLLSPEEAEHVAKEDYVPSPEAEQTIRDLLAGFPDDFSFQGITLGRDPLYKCLLQVRNDDWLLSLRYVYQNGHQLAEQLQNLRIRIVYAGPGKKPISSVDSMRQVYPSWSDEALAAGWLSHTIHALAWVADRKRPAGPAYEQARARFNRLVKINPREEVALNYLFDAARQSGSVEEDAEVLTRKAVELLVEGSDHTQKWDRWFDADIEAAMKELLGLKEPSEARDYPGAASWPESTIKELIEELERKERDPDAVP